MMKFLIVTILFSTHLLAGSDWSGKLSAYRPLKFVIHKEGLKTVEEAKTFLKKSITTHYQLMDQDYKSRLKVPYSPFGSKWQIGKIENELEQLATLEKLLSPEFETKINGIITSDYKDFYASEYLIANHKVFDHEQEIFELKKEIIFLNQQIELLRKSENEEAAPAEQEQQSSVFLVISVLIGAAAISVLVKRSKFI